MSVKLRRRKLANGKVSLYLDIYHNGKRQYEFLKLYLDPKDRKGNKETLQLAENIRAKRQLEIQSLSYGAVPQFKRRANFVAYFAQLAEKKNKNWGQALKYLNAYTSGQVSFASITEQWLEAFRDHLLNDTGLSQSSARLYFAKVRAALRQAFKDKIINSNPAERVKQIAPVESVRTYLTIEELRQLAATPIKHDYIKRAFLFSCYTGLRLGDVRGLEWGQITNDGIQFRQQKTNGVEYLPLSDQARRLIGEPGDAEKLVFPEFHASNATIATTLKDWYRDAGLKKHVTFHTARHTFATLAITNGVDLYTVSKLLGHKSIQVTQIYAKIIDEKKRQAIDLLPAIEL